MTELDILLPFGLPPPELAGDLLKQLDAPSLALLSSRAKSENGRHETVDGFRRALPHEQWLARQFGLDASEKTNSSPAIAAAWMPELDLSPDPGTWFALQPVHIHIARDHLVLTDPRQLVLSEDDSRALFEIAAPLFEEAGKRVLYGNATTWFVEADEWRDLETATPDAAAGHNIDIWMPKGPGERDWRKVQNEVQMHWYGHPLNDEREARGLKPVNSLWLWAGPSTHGQEKRCHYDKAFNLSGYQRALRQYLPAHGEASNAADLVSSAAGRNMLYLDDLLEPALANDWGRWLGHMQHLEESWFAPLLEALQSGRIDTVSLIATHDSRISRFTVTRSSLRKFWVKPSLTPLCP
ncbi:hypothetical protein [Noviherbaspirillum denitrificans]|uniref:Uncharacterized protein n=1 Tax=Noviherbaspirillum denitrificans TaxID=1968433 RepID=A0A254TLF5_9BURK|nr:hypothetical protein [Noviherbaspirillum denitrificans]OWW23057.1 hypothetical protein AYR66_25105 [Noviherbaspirillum denitrificans]